jgi:formate-dependent nitrite reductase membrane component NrfD
MSRREVAASMELNPQRVWSWKIAAYLFLAGVSSGALLVGAVAHLLNPNLVGLMRAGLWLGIPLLAVGILFLLWDLGQPIRFAKALLKPGTSWISRGSWILTFLLAVSVILFGLWIWPFTFFDRMAGAVSSLEVLVIVFAFGTMVYTGLLLGASKPIPFWSTPTLPLLFTVSAIATGMKGSSLVLTLGSLVYGTALPEIAPVLARYVAVLIAVEIGSLALHLWGTSQTATGKLSSKRVLFGELAPQFWFGYVALGLVIPLLAELAIPGIGVGQEVLWILTASTLGLVGGFLLRLTVVSAGAKTPLPTFGGSLVIPQNM